MAWRFSCYLTSQPETQNNSPQSSTPAHLLSAAWMRLACSSLPMITQHFGLPFNTSKSGAEIYSTHPSLRNYFGSSIKLSQPGCVLPLFWSRIARCPIGRSLLLHSKSAQKIFIWSLCFFFAPLAAIGLFPYLLIEWFKQTDFKSPFKNLRFDLLLASGVVLLISYLFFSSNTAAQERGFQAIALKDFLAFFLLEGGILWLLLAPLKWRDPRWAVTGLLLAIIPFIQLGSGRDFVMRASIAPLFCLMLMTGEAIFQKTTPRFLLITCYLLLAHRLPYPSLRNQSLHLPHLPILFCA